MAHFECMGTNEECGNCSDIVNLFAQLHIPSGEQIVLWNIAHRKMDNNGLKNLLVHLLDIHKK
ncbi:MAG: hypothetical protein H6Q17_2299 [Bacteroidetes bacterium]|nr:hypothetical protein [Bacteroidota bacterium]